MALNELIASPYGKILRQGPTTVNNPEAADYYGAKFDGDGSIFGPFLVGDSKQPGEFKQAITQTGKYAHDVIEDRKDKTMLSNPMILGLYPCTYLC